MKIKMEEVDKEKKKDRRVKEPPKKNKVAGVASKKI